MAKLRPIQAYVKRWKVDPTTGEKVEVWVKNPRLNEDGSVKPSQRVPKPDPLDFTKPSDN